MKPETKIKKQIERIDKWLAEARIPLQNGYLSGSKEAKGVFYLLVAVERMQETLKMLAEYTSSSSQPK